LFSAKGPFCPCAFLKRSSTFWLSSSKCPITRVMGLVICINRRILRRNRVVYLPREGSTLHLGTKAFSPAGAI